MKILGSITWQKRWLCTAALLLLPFAAGAATCTSKASGSWASSGTWTCTGTPIVTIPGATDSAVIASPNTVSLVGSVPVTNLTVNSGGTLNTAGFTLTVSGNLANNGTVSGVAGSGGLGVTGNASVVSGTGAISNVYWYFSGTTPSIAAGSALTFSGSSRLYAGMTSGGATVSGSVLTINGTINSTVPAATTSFMRLYANSTVIGATGAISASVSSLSYRTSTATLTNNGSVTLQQISQNSATNSWTQGVNSRLTLSAASSVGTLYASANGNTVTYIAPATPMTPNGNTYFNLAGSGVTCPHAFIVLGSDPCAVVGGGFVVSSPGSCINKTGVGTIAWVNPGNALTSNNVYAAASNLRRSAITNYLYCTGFNFSGIPAGATINGITVYVERNTNGGTVRDAYVYLIKGGVIQTGYNAATTTNYTTTDVVEQHGGATNKWGATWTDADFKTANFGVAFSAKEAANFSSNRTASVDQIYVRVDYTASSADHVTISTSNLGSTCAPNNVTLVAHTATHTAAASGGTLRLTTSDGKGDWTVVTGAGTLSNGVANDGLATYAFGVGESSVVLALTHTTGGTITIGVANDATGASLLTNTPANEMANTIAYSAGGFTITDAAGTPITNLTQIAGQVSPTYYLKATSSSCGNAFNNVTRNVDMAFECIDPVSCQAGQVVSVTNATTNVATALSAGVPAGSNPATVTTYTPVSLNFNANSLAPFKLVYPDVGKITLYFRYSPSSLLSESVPFVVKPAGFVLSAIKRTSDSFANPAAVDGAGAKFVKAGEAFSVTVTAVSATGMATPNYGHEVVAEGVTLTPALVSGLGLMQNPALNGSFGPFSAGAAVGTAFSWDEVGIITLTPSVGDGDYLGVGNVVGTASGNVGRFYPDHFAVTEMPFDNRADWCAGGFLAADGTTPCASPAFTYMGELFNANFILTAKSATNVTTQNYDGAFTKLTPLAANNTLNYGAVDFVRAASLTGRLDTSLVSANGTGAFVNGVADLTVPLAITRGTAVDGPYTELQIGIVPVDSDGVAALLNLDTNGDGVPDHALVGSVPTEVRYGRIRLTNAHGSELLPLPITATVQYFDGAQWQVSADDNVTWFNTNLNTAGGDLAATVVTGLAGGVSVATPGVVTVSGGVRRFQLNPPGSAGSVDLVLGAPPYLPSNIGRATFGVYKGGNEFIYLRENY